MRPPERFPPDDPQEWLNRARSNGDGQVRSGTVTRAKAACLCYGAVLPPERVRAQLFEQRGGADAVFDGQGKRIGGARMTAVVTLKPGEKGRHYRLPVDADYAAVREVQSRLADILGEWERGGRQAFRLSEAAGRRLGDRRDAGGGRIASIRYVEEHGSIAQRDAHARGSALRKAYRLFSRTPGSLRAREPFDDSPSGCDNTEGTKCDAEALAAKAVQSEYTQAVRRTPWWVFRMSDITTGGSTIKEIFSGKASNSSGIMRECSGYCVSQAYT